jgi:hypothetical protein
VPIAAGADSVASALGAAADATRCGCANIPRGSVNDPIRGTFYLAGSRNFLFGSNTGEDF